MYSMDGYINIQCSSEEIYGVLQRKYMCDCQSNKLAIHYKWQIWSGYVWDSKRAARTQDKKKLGRAQVYIQINNTQGILVPLVSNGL